MKVFTLADAWEAYRRISDLVLRGKRSYEFYSSGQSVHEYGNKANSAQAALTLLQSKLSSETPVQDLQVYVNRAYSLACDLIYFSGSQYSA
jgi:hypothetical protein